MDRYELWEERLYERHLEQLEEEEREEREETAQECMERLKELDVQYLVHMGRVLEVTGAKLDFPVHYPELSEAWTNALVWSERHEEALVLFEAAMTFCEAESSKPKAKRAKTDAS